MKIKETKMRDKYLDLSREQNKKQRNMRVIVIPIFINALETVLKGLEKGLEESEIGR